MTSSDAVGRADGFDAAFTALAESLTDERAEPSELHRITRLATRTIPGVEHASITVIDVGRAPRTEGSTGPLPDRVDEIQYHLGEGPCLQATRTDGRSLAQDLRTDGQWPRFAAAVVAQTAVRGMLGFRLILNDQQHAALNLYATRPNAFSDDSVTTGTIFAAYGSLALIAALRRRDVENLQRAVRSNRSIGVAVGVLMSGHRLTEEQAFARLRTASNHHNRRLVDIAAEVALTGALPGTKPRTVPGAAITSPTRAPA